MLTLMPSLKLFNNFIEKEDIDFLIKWIDNNCNDQKKFRHRVGIAFDKGLAVRAIFPDEKPPSMFKDLKDVITKASNKFMEIQKEHMNDGKDHYFYGVSITKLSKDIQLRMHQDVHNDFSTLSYSAVLYLNDNYEGGEACFLKDFVPFSDFPLYDDSMNGITFKPSAGDLSIFPSDLWHGGKRVVNGDRYSIIFWSTTEKEYEFAGFDSNKVLAKINTKAAELGYN
jgi:hypothetical protein